MRFDEALQLPPLNRGVVVSADAHLNQEISWVQVVDHPDIEAWVEKGHLLLSTGYSWPKTGAAAAVIIEKLAAKGVAGVVLAVPHFVEHFPAESIEAANQHGFPLIEVPWEVPFSEITQCVHRELLSQQSRSLERSDQIHRQLTEAAVSGDGLQDVAQVLGGVLDRSVQIYSIQGTLLADFIASPCGTHNPPFASSVFLALSAGGGIKVMDSQTRAVRWHPRPSRLATKTQSVVGSVVRSRTERLGYVLVAEGNPPLNEIDLRAIEHAATVAALQISHQRELSAQETRMGHALVASLIEGQFDAKPNTLERSRLAGWDDEIEYRLASILMDEPNPLSNEGFRRREALALALSRVIQIKGATPLISLSANQIHALLPEGFDFQWLWTEIAAKKAAMGVSQAHRGVEGMHMAGKEIMDLMAHVRPGRIHYFDEAIFPRVLAGDPKARKMFIDKLFGRVGTDKRSQHLLDTAMALADEGFNLQRAADRLNVHISTLRYRLGKLAEVTGLDLDTVEGRFRLQYGVRLYLAEQP